MRCCVARGWRTECSLICTLFSCARETTGKLISVAKFRKLGGKSSATAQIYTSSENSKLHPHILLIQFCSQLHPFSYFQKTSSPEIAFIVIMPVFTEISVYSFFLHLTSLNVTSFATSYPQTKNKLGHPELSASWALTPGRAGRVVSSCSPR